jgi:hypothetical protein
MAGTLKIWNGNVQSMVPYEEAKRHGISYNGYAHGYGCARSRADLCRMIIEWSGGSRGLDAYIRDYWSEGAWGIAMDGIAPERGLWVQYGYGAQPQRVWPPTPSPVHQGEVK